MNKRVLIWLLLSMTFLGVSGTDIYIPSLPQMVRDFHTTPTIMNSTILFFTVGMAISVLYSGVLSNRFGRKVVLIAGVLVFSLAGLLIVFAETIWLVLWLRVIQGIGCGGIIVVQRLILRDTMNEREQIHAGGMLALGATISPAIAPIIGAFLAKLWSWHLCFLFSAVLGAVITLISLVIIKETNTTPIKKLPNLVSYLHDYMVLLRDPICLNLVIILTMTFAAYFAFIGISSYLYITNLGLSPIVYSYIFALLAGSYFAGNSYMMYLNKSGIASSQIIKQGVLCGVVGGLISFLSLIGHHHWLILISLTVGVVITRIAAALVINPIQIKITNHFKERGALALGIAICLQFGLAGVAAAVVGLFTEPRLLYGFVCLSNAFLILAALSFFILARQESRS